MPETRPCRRCGNPIWFLKTPSGATMPLDADPVEDGNVIVKDGMAVVLKQDLFSQPPEGPRYLSHFATCPAPREFRKKKGKKR